MSESTVLWDDQQVWSDTQVWGVPVDLELVTLAEVKQQLDKTSNADDVELQAYIAAVRGVIERMCGPILPKSRDVTVTAWGDTLLLPSERTTGTVTISPGVTATTAGNGVLRGSFAGTYRVTYVEGMSAVPPEVNLAARIIVASWWRTQRGSQVGGAVAAGGPDDLSPYGQPTPPIPAMAITLLSPWMRGPAIA